MAKINNHNRWSIVGLAGLMLVISTTVTVRHFYAKNLKQAETARDLATAQVAAAKLAHEKILADKEKSETEYRLAIVEREKATAERQLAEKMREDAIAKDQEMLAFVESLNYPVAVLDQDGKVIVWNAAAERDFGWTLADLQASGIESIMPEEMRPRHTEKFGAAMRGEGKAVNDKRGKLQSVDCVVIHKDKSKGLIPVDARVRAGRMADGTRYAMANLDIKSRIVKVEAEPK